MALWALGDAVPQVDPDAWVHPGAQLIGNVVVRGFANVWPGAVLRADFGVLVGSGAVLLNGACVRTGGIVAAGALLVTNMEVRSGWRAQGVPATLAAHDGTPAQVRSGAENYRRLAHRYADELRPVEVPH